MRFRPTIEVLEALIQGACIARASARMHETEAETADDSGASKAKASVYWEVAKWLDELADYAAGTRCVPPSPIGEKYSVMDEDVPFI